MIENPEENHARGRFPTTKVIKVIDEGLQIKVKLWLIAIIATKHEIEFSQFHQNKVIDAASNWN